ncbi:MAG TPA: hypothetical protein VFF64_20865 [Candidatus Eremiobacteraceae bacterium]|nr:hypothetical protein [Candidatus Eremiobacteraceae bacterium]
MLRLRNVSGSGASFMLLVPNTETSQPSDLSQIVLITRSSGSYVSTMQLPESGLTLHFTVPNGTREMSQSIATSIESAAR